MQRKDSEHYVWKFSPMTTRDWKGLETSTEGFLGLTSPTPPSKHRRSVDGHGTNGKKRDMKESYYQMRLRRVRP